MDYKTLASKEVVTKTIDAIKAKKGFDAVSVENEAEALEKIKSMIPQGASVTNGSSTTLKQIGYIDYLKSNTHGWDNLHEKVLKEQDKEKQSYLRRETTISDYYLGSVHAMTEEGDIVIASNSASQLPSVTYNSQNLILVVGTHKIVPTLADAMKRLEEYVVPLEDKRMQTEYRMGTQLSKILIFKKESPMSDRKITVIFVNKALGF